MSTKTIEKMSYLSWKFKTWLPRLDAPEPNQVYLSDPATVYMDGLLDFNQHLLATIVAVVVVVGWLLLMVLVNYREFHTTRKEIFFHSKDIETAWTAIPALTLLSLAPGSFALLYSLDEVVTPRVTVKIIGHQWFWEYEISDYDYILSCLNWRCKTIKYTCYMLSTETLLQNGHLGFLRLLETNKRVLIPSNAHIRLLITSVDVLHSWTVPSFGIKVDACPGRLNQIFIFLKRAGLFFGQCSEICGVNHGFMPIALFAVPSTQFESLLISKIK